MLGLFEKKQGSRHFLKKLFSGLKNYWGKEDLSRFFEVSGDEY